MTPDVIASFTVGGCTFEDVNPLARSNRQNRTTITGVRPANANAATMPAEFGAMLQALEAGIRGGRGVLVIQKVRCCPWCRGDVKTLARALQLESLVIHDADGSTVEFLTPQELLPVRQGGKRWN